MRRENLTRKYLVVTADGKAAMVEADNVIVDDQGNLNMWRDGAALVGAFGRGFWCSCVEQPGQTDG